MPTGVSPTPPCRTAGSYGRANYLIVWCWRIQSSFFPRRRLTNKLRKHKGLGSRSCSASCCCCTALCRCPLHALWSRSLSCCCLQLLGLYPAVMVLWVMSFCGPPGQGRLTDIATINLHRHNTRGDNLKATCGDFLLPFKHLHFQPGQGPLH